MTDDLTELLRTADRRHSVRPDERERMRAAFEALIDAPADAEPLVVELVGAVREDQRGSTRRNLRWLAAAAAMLAAAAIGGLLPSPRTIDSVDDPAPDIVTTTSAAPTPSVEENPSQAAFEPTPRLVVDGAEPGRILGDVHYTDIDGWVGFDGSGLRVSVALGGDPHLTGPDGELDIAITRPSPDVDISSLQSLGQLDLTERSTTPSGHDIWSFTVSGDGEAERCFLGDRCTEILFDGGVAVVVVADGNVLHVVDRDDLGGLVVTATAPAAASAAALDALVRLADSVFVPG